MKKEQLCTVASGSGGHILPALILTQEWHEKNPGGSILFCGGSSTLEKKIIGNYPFITTIASFTITRFIPHKIWLYPKIIMQLFYALYKSFRLMVTYRPTTIISTGGLIAIPIIIIGRLFGSRVEIYELNVIPGKAVKALMPLAHAIYTPFQQTSTYCSLAGISFAYKCHLCAYPIRFKEQDKIYHKKQVLQSLNSMVIDPTQPFTETRKTIFLLGGSQGSLLLNNAMKKFLSVNSNIAQYLQVIHQVGVQDSFGWTDFYKKMNIPAITFGYHEHVKNFYNIADIIICRAGAGTLFEIEFFNKKCIVIPLVATSTAHQINNAREMAKKHPSLFTIIEQAAISNNFDQFNDTIIKQLLPGA